MTPKLSILLLFAVMTLSILSPAQASYDCQIHQSRDPVLGDLRKGNIRPDIVGSRLQLFPCFKKFIVNMQQAGWAMKTVTLSLDQIAYGVEGHDQFYLIAVPLRKESPDGPVWQIKKFRYINAFDMERLVEIIQPVDHEPDSY